MIARKELLMHRVLPKQQCNRLLSFFEQIQAESVECSASQNTVVHNTFGAVAGFADRWREPTEPTRYYQPIVKKSTRTGEAHGSTITFF